MQPNHINNISESASRLSLSAEILQNTVPDKCILAAVFNYCVTKSYGVMAHCAFHFSHVHLRIRCT